MRRGRLVRAVSCLVAVGVLAGACSATPPPPAPVATTTTTPSGEAPSQIVVSVDDVAGGYNPHRVADTSTVTSALSQLVLPSVFREDEQGSLRLDETLMISAKVVEQDPFTVAYRIRPDAQWSDGVPIAAEDFSYLAEAVRTQPGTVAPAGYGLITEVASRDGGKRVEVTFEEPYPRWRSLFGDLLPAHLLKDAPGGWNSALSGGFPAYGGPFSVKILDKTRGEIILERNERYWDKPAAVDQLVLRRSDRPGMVSALRSGNDQFALTLADAEDVTAFSGLGERFVQHTVTRPVVVEVLLRQLEGRLGDDPLRQAVAALLDRPRLVAAGAQGGPSGALRADAQVLAPSQRWYRPSAPAAYRSADPARAARLFGQAGYVRSEGAWRSRATGEPLTLVVASPAEREPYARVAAELEAMLTDAGVTVERVQPPARELAALLPFGEPGEAEEGGETASQSGAVDIDIVVAPRVVSDDFGADLASVSGCAWPSVDNGATASPDGGGNPRESEFCTEDRRAVVLAALTGERTSGEALRALEPSLWRENSRIPLFQLAETMVLGDGVSGVTPGPGLIGPFGSAVNWIRTAR